MLRTTQGNPVVGRLNLRTSNLAEGSDHFRDKANEAPRNAEMLYFSGTAKAKAKTKAAGKA